MTTTETHEHPKPVRRKRGQEGINVRHRLNCPTRGVGTCTCQPAYQAQAWSALEGKQIRKTFASLADAKAWRQNTQVGLRQGTVRAPSPTTLNQAASEWLAAARTGVVRTRSGDPYKPSTPSRPRQPKGQNRLSTKAGADPASRRDECHYAPANTHHCEGK